MRRLLLTALICFFGAPLLWSGVVTFLAEMMKGDWKGAFILPLAVLIIAPAKFWPFLIAAFFGSLAVVQTTSRWTPRNALIVSCAAGSLVGLLFPIYLAYFGSSQFNEHELYALSFFWSGTMGIFLSAAIWKVVSVLRTPSFFSL